MTTVFSWREALQSCNLASTTKLILLNLSIYMNEKGEGCYPSISRQAKDTNLSEKTVCEHLHKATIAGFLCVSKQHLAGQQWARNSYRAVYPPSVNLYRAENAMMDDDDATQKGTYRTTMPLLEGTYFDGGKALTHVHTNSSGNSPIKKEKNIQKKPMLIQEWESITGVQLNADMLKSWCQQKGIARAIIAELVEEFRIDMIGKGKAYADFRAAFQTYLTKGYLSSTLSAAQIKSRRLSITEVHNRGVNL